MENLSKDVLALLALELNYPDILALCNTNTKNRKTCNRYWTEKAIRDFGVDKDDIIGDPLSFYFGLKDNKGHYWYFEDVFWDFSEPRFSVNRENLSIKWIQNEDELDNPNFYIPGIKYPKGEKAVVVYFSAWSKKAESNITFSVVSKTKERTFQKMIQKIENEYWSDIKEDKIYQILQNAETGTGLRDKVNIPMGYNDNLYSHDVNYLMFETTV